MKRPLEGLIAATILPFTNELSIDERSLRRHVRRLVAERALGIAVNVDSGEGVLLTPEERLQTIRIVANEIGREAVVVAGLIATTTKDAVDQARRSEDAGADALLVFPSPVFRGKPLPVDLPVEYYSRIAESVDLDLIIFQLHDVLGGVLYDDEHLIALGRIPGVVGMKEASFDASRFLQTLQTLRKNDVSIKFLTGNDFFLYESYVMGADGALIGFGNLALADQVQMFQLIQAKQYEEAIGIASKLEPLIDVIFRPPLRDYRARIKHALVQLGIIETALVRPPLPNITADEALMVQEALRKGGYTIGAEVRV